MKGINTLTYPPKQKSIISGPDMSLTYSWKCAVLTDVYYLEVCETLRPFLCVSALLTAVKCEGYCTPRHNYHVSSESAWLGEPLGLMCQMITGKETEWRQ